MAKLASVFEPDDETEQQALTEARAAIAAGEYVEHEAVMQWVKSWFKSDELPTPLPK